MEKVFVLLPDDPNTSLGLLDYFRIVKPLQTLGYEVKWAAYRNRFFSRSHITNMALNLIIENKIKKVKPDALIVLKGESLIPGILNRIRDSGVLTVNWAPDDIFGVLNSWNRIMNLSEYDHIFCMDRYNVEELKNRGLKAHYLPASAIPEVNKDYELQKVYNVTFIGSHNPEREQLLNQLTDFDINIWGPRWDRIDKKSKLCRFVRGGMQDGVSMSKKFNQSRITLNLHDKQAIRAVNSRVFESLACRTFLLSDYNEEINSLFDVGREIICYRNVKELRDLLGYYLENNEEREKIVSVGYKKVHAEHLPIHRIKKMVEIIGHN